MHVHGSVESHPFMERRMSTPKVLEQARADAAERSGWNAAPVEIAATDTQAHEGCAVAECSDGGGATLSA